MKVEPNQQTPGGISMDCQRIEDEDMIERYLTGRLPQPDSDAFEEHYLGCERCFEELQFRHAAAIELKQNLTPSSSHASRTSWPARWAWGLAAAAVLLLAFVSVLLL